MLPAIFEPTTPASDWPQTVALDRSTTGVGFTLSYLDQIYLML